ncbi:hypothetical protein R3X27_09640 [Tropicimonas sp. TH_r6]|uniref:hypothetical protein n=1 Tax=Tropicimonas sp. TH_r6 TaxID=3082085 RepID=UPI002953F42F|nr:hypothetical protein [Tropicimonas sp. TH_r6]MDV7142948.1 hypothetical protein [Tropicimonas sp. TH_r6]
MAITDLLRAGALLLLGAAPLVAEGLGPAELATMDACLVESATGRDVANTTVTCFNDARTVCGADVLGCEAAMAEALEQRAVGLLERMPSELEGVPEFAKERYTEILVDIDAGAVTLCDDVPETMLVSCGYRAQALRLAKLRSLAAQLDPRFLIP